MQPITQQSAGFTCHCCLQMTVRLILLCSTQAPPSTPLGLVLHFATIPHHTILTSDHHNLQSLHSVMLHLEWLRVVCFSTTGGHYCTVSKVSYPVLLVQVCFYVFLPVFHSSLDPGQMYTVDVLTQSGIRPDEFPSTSHSAGPLQFWTRRLYIIFQCLAVSKFRMY